MIQFRPLEAHEITTRVQQAKKNGCSLLLYKNSRVDMDILDETVTPFCWSRTHDVVNDNLFCTVGIYDGDKWIYKQDVGTESNTEKEKGQASDSFKRACVNWGIGRELYTSPFIWIKLDDSETEQKNGKDVLKFGVKFSVASIGYDAHRRINQLSIVDQNGKERYKLGKATSPAQATKPVEQAPTPPKKENVPTEQPRPSEAQMKRLFAIQKSSGKSTDEVKAYMKEYFDIASTKELLKWQYDQIINWMEGKA